VDGRLIRTLVDEERTAGSHEVSWDGCDAEGRRWLGSLFLQAGRARNRGEPAMILLP